MLFEGSEGNRFGWGTGFADIECDYDKPHLKEALRSTC